MKVPMISAAKVNEAVKALKRVFEAHTGQTMSLSRAQETLARMLGFTSFHELRKIKEGQEHVPLDDDLDKLEVAARRRYQSETLSSITGISVEKAIEIVVDAEPSGGRRDRRKFTLSPDLREDVLAALRDTLQNRRRGKTARETVISRVATILSKPTNRPVDIEESISSFAVRPMPRYSTRLVPLGGFGMYKEETYRNGEAKVWNAAKEEIAHILLDSMSGDVSNPYRETPLKLLGARIAQELACEVTDVSNAFHEAGGFHDIAEELLKAEREHFDALRVVDTIVKRRNEHGFFAWTPTLSTEDTVEAEYWRPLEFDTGKKKASFPCGAATVHIEITREREGDEPGEPLAFYYVLAKAEIDQKVVGLLRGEVITNRKYAQGIADLVFYMAAENKGGDITHLAHILTMEHTDAYDLFREGDLLYLAHWEVTPELAGTGFAKDFLEAVVGDLKKRHKRLRNVAYEARPLQYEHPFPDASPPAVQRSYYRDRMKLSGHLDRTLRSILPGRRYQFDVTEKHDALTDEERVMAQYAIDRHPDHSLSTIRRPFRRFAYPDGRSGLIWQTTKYWNPHPAIWSRMPPTLQRITILTADSDAPGCTVDRIRFTFDNGEHLEGDPEWYLDPGYNFEDEFDFEGERNVFAPGYSQRDFAYCLRANLGLLFSEEAVEGDFRNRALSYDRYGRIRSDERMRDAHLRTEVERGHIPRQYSGQRPTGKLLSDPMQLAPYRFNYAFKTGHFGRLFLELNKPGNSRRVFDAACSELGSRVRNLPPEARELAQKIEMHSLLFQEARCLTVDVSAMIAPDVMTDAKLAERVISELPEWLDEREAFFLAFVSQSFPSPHEDARVDGCYVSHNSQGILLFFTCSMDSELFEDGASMLDLCTQWARGVQFFISPGVRFEHHLELMEKTVRGEWIPFLTAPLRAVFNALSMLEQGNASLARSSFAEDCEYPMLIADRLHSIGRISDEAPIIIARPDRNPALQAVREPNTVRRSRRSPSSG